MKTKVALILTVLINCFIIYQYMDLEKQGLNWWSAIVLRDIVIYFLIFLEMLKEYYLWNRTLFKWREELVFEQRFAQTDNSETFIKRNIQSMIDEMALQGEDAKMDQEKLNQSLPVEKEVSVSLKNKKVMALDNTIYSCSYVALIKSNKKKYRLTQGDQFDLLYKLMLIMAIQVFFISCVLYFNP